MLRRNVGKIRVEIIGGAYPKKINAEVEGNHVIIQPGAKGRGGAPYKAEYDNSCLVPYWSGFSIFKTIKFKLLLKEGASKCVSFAKSAAEIAPTCTQQDIARFSNATVIRNAGMLKPENRTFVYVLLLINIVISILAVAVASGRLAI